MTKVLITFFLCIFFLGIVGPIGLMLVFQGFLLFLVERDATNFTVFVGAIYYFVMILLSIHFFDKYTSELNNQIYYETQF